MAIGPSPRGNAPSLALAFLIGASAGCVCLWPVFSKSKPASEADATSITTQPSPPIKIAHGFTEKGAVGASPDITSANETSSDLKADFTGLLAEALHAPDTEREVRLGLVLGRLRRGGEQSVPLIREYLASGRDLPATSARRVVGGNLTFRILLLDTLAEIVSDNPVLAAQVANECLLSARTMEEARTAVDVGKPSTPADLRAAAIAAVQRLRTENPDHVEISATAEIAARTQAQELIPLLAESSRPPAKSASDNMPYLLAALRLFPDSVRKTATLEWLADDGVQKSLQDNPELYLMLDLDDPAQRHAVVAGFASLVNDDKRAQFLFGLAYADSLSEFGKPRSKTPRVLPYPPPQPNARLEILAQIAPSCSPALKENLAATRDRLARWATPR